MVKFILITYGFLHLWYVPPLPCIPAFPNLVVIHYKTWYDDRAT